MAVWDKASWQGPPDSNYSGAMSEFRGLVWHIAEGSYWGTIAWQQNSISDVSSHFVIGLNEGEIAQMLDTTVTAWTQAAGNGHWVSVEFAGFSTGQLTAAQFEAAAQLYAWLVQVHGIPIQLADSPSGTGLGWHGMGGVAWGGHFGCPGSANVALRPSNLVRVAQILGQGPPDEESDMPKLFRVNETGMILVTSGSTWYHLQTPGLVEAAQRIWGFGEAAPLNLEDLPACGAQVPFPATGGGGGGTGPSLADITATVRAEIDKTHLPSVPGKLGV